MTSVQPAEQARPEPVVAAPSAVSPRWTSRPGAQRIVAIAVLVGFATVLAVVVWPGRMSADTLVQIDQVRSGAYTDWHAGVLLVLWRPFWLIGIGPGVVTWTAIVTFVLGLYGIVRIRYGRWISVALAMAITMLPPVVGYVIYLGRDMWFTTFFVVGCAALVMTVRCSGRWRVGAMILLGVATWLMLAARQNALPACFVLVLGAAWLGLPSSADRRFAGWRRAGAAIGLAAVGIVALVSSQAVMRRIFDVQSLHIEQSVFIYDLAAISHEEREVLFDPEVFPAQDLAVLDRYFTPSSFEPLVFAPNAVIRYPLPADHVDELRADWLDAVRDHPATYAEARLRLWLAQIAVTEPSSWVVHPGIDANGWGYTAENPALDRALQRYIRVFAANDALAGGPLHTVWMYLLVLVGGLGYLWSKRLEYRCLGWMALACLAYQFGLLFGLMIAGYRFNLPCVVIAWCVVAVVVGDVVAWARARHVSTAGPERLAS